MGNPRVKFLYQKKKEETPSTTERVSVLFFVGSLAESK